MNELFLKIINMSISASWLVLAVLLLRLLFKKAPKWVNVLFWGIVAMRLICPFSFESALSLIPSAETISPIIMTDKTPSVHTGIPVINSVINPVIGESFAPAPGDSANPLQIWIPILSIIWLIGVAVLLLYTAVSYWRLRGRVSEAVILRDNICQSENVGSPFVLGIMKPKVYLPYKINGQDLCNVVEHEQAHIRRKDHWWKPLGFLLLTIHWFNPLIWAAYVLMCRDIELACDEKVIKELGSEQRADYTRTLVACSVNRRMIAACPLAFGEVGVKERVKSVMNYRKPAFWIVLLAVITCVAVAVCFLTNPKTDDTPVSAEDGYFFLIGADGVESIEITGINTIGGVVNADGSVFKNGEKVWLEPLQGVTDLRGYSITALGKNGEIIYALSIPEGATNDEVINLVGSDGWLLAPTDFEVGLAGIAGKTYVYEGEGIMGSFDITLYDDGTYTDYEGMPSRKLTLDDLVALSQKGQELTWSDFDDYSYIETGSGLYIRVYEINEMYELWIGGGSPDSDPMYIYLALADDTDTRIDIRDGGVEEFVAADHSEVLLTKAICNAILEHNKPEKPDDLYHCADFVLLSLETASGTPLAGAAGHMETVNVYGLALYQTYGFSGHTFNDAGGSHIPVAITFEVQDGKYTLKEYWEPRDGSCYAQDIREKFPDAVEADAMDTQKYIRAQKQHCYDQAIRYCGVDTNYAVEHLFEVIESSPAESSRPSDYIDAHPVEYRELTYYGNYTLEYIFSQFLEGNQTGLRGHLMRAVLDDLAPEARLRLYAETGQEYFDEWKAGAIQVSEQHDMDWIKENQPAIWLLLRMIGE